MQHWGEPRVTLDVDLTLFAEHDEESRAVKQFLTRFQPRVANAIEFAHLNRVLLLQSSDGVGIDVALGCLPFEHQFIERAMNVRFWGDTQLKLCTAEDLILLKAFAARGQDWLDVEKILVRQGGALDWRYIEREIVPLANLKEAPEIVEKLKLLRAGQRYD